MTPIFARKYKGFRNFHKDALGREKNHQKWVLLRDTCDYPTPSNAYFSRVSEPKLSDDMKGENFSTPPKALSDE